MRKLKVVQIGVCHEHANGKFETTKRMSDTFDLVGVVDERGYSTTPRVSDYSHLVKDVPHLTEEEVYRIPDLDLVLVEVPNMDLVPTALRVMEHNLPMHLDKPAGDDLAAYKRLLDGCEQRGLALQMGYMFRGNPVFQFVQQLVRAGAFGDIHSIDMDMDHCYGGEPYQEYLNKMKGGIMFNLGCHLIDFIVSLLGEPSRVVPFLKSTPDVPDTCANNTLAVLEYPYATACVRACSRKPAGGAAGQRHCRIAGTQGCCEWEPLERFDSTPLKLRFYLSKPCMGFFAGPHTIEFPPQSDRYAVQLRELADVVRGLRASSYSYQHDYLVHKVTLAAAGYEGLY